MRAEARAQLAWAPERPVVLDASAVVELLLGTPRGVPVRERLAGGGSSLHAPHLIDLEVVSALRRWVVQRKADADAGSTALVDLQDLPLTRYPHSALLPRIWELRANASAYDAAYLSLAEALDAPLVTCDERLAGIPGHRAVVEVITT